MDATSTKFLKLMIYVLAVNVDVTRKIVISHDMAPITGCPYQTWDQFNIEYFSQYWYWNTVKLRTLAGRVYKPDSSISRYFLKKRYPTLL